MIASLKTHQVWDKLIEIYPFAGNETQAALIKLKAASSSPNTLLNHGFLSANYQETGSSGGFKGDGLNKYLDSGLPILGLTRDDISIGVYINSDCSVTSSFGVSIGSSYNATGDNDRFYFIGSSSNSGANGQAGLGNQYTAGRIDGPGFRAMSYNGASFDTYKGSVGVSTVASAVAWQQAGTVTLFKGAGNFYYDGNLDFGFVGLSLSASEENDLYNAIQTFETALLRSL